MKSRGRWQTLAALTALAGIPAWAQDIRHAAPPTVPPAAPAAPLPGEPAPAEPSAPVTGEAIVLAELKGIVLLPDADAAGLQRTVSGVDVSAVALAHRPVIAEFLRGAIGRPASLASLNRLADGLRRLLRATGQPFVAVWLPPQDLTAGSVRIVVRPAELEGPVGVVGAEKFGADAYLRWIRQTPDQAIDVQSLQEDIAWINRNPFRNATLAAEPGSRPGATRLSLRVNEEDPLRAFFGAENNGTRTTEKNRVFLGFNWGDAFGRGDQASYQLRGDPHFRHSITHSGSYQADLPWRHVLALNAAWSRTKPDLGPDFGQTGTSWQLGLRYLMPDMWRTDGWEGDYSVGLDYKFADNNLEFAAIPILGNETRIVQAVLGTTLRQKRGADGGTTLNLNLMLSPGGAVGHNNDDAFDPSRQGAPARYAYVRVDAQNSQRVLGNWRWEASATAQWANVALLGSEQIVAGGAGVLRGFPESAVFGDRGVTLGNELHVPAMSWNERGVQADPFVFLDVASLATRGPGAGSIELASAGFGAEIAWGRKATLRLAVGWPIRQPEGSDLHGATGHLRLQFNY